MNNEPEKSPQYLTLDRQEVKLQFMGLLVMLSTVPCNQVDPQTMTSNALPTNSQVVPTRLLFAQELLTDIQRYRADHDRLTGLLKERAWFDEVLRQHGEGGHVAFLDLDGFKAVNDEYGHDEADEKVLKPVADTLRSCGFKIIACRRSEGDEFMIYIPRDAKLEGLQQHIKKKFSEINQTLRGTAKAGVTIGIVSVGNQELSADKLRTLLQAADQMVINAKKEREQQNNRGLLVGFIMKILKLSDSNRGNPSDGSINFIYDKQQ